jgi:hypothetical protein
MLNPEPDRFHNGNNTTPATVFSDASNQIPWQNQVAFAPPAVAN